MSEALQEIVDGTSDLIIRGLELGNAKFLTSVLVSADRIEKLIEAELLL